MSDMQASMLGEHPDTAYEAALAKRHRLEAEIRESSANTAERMNMIHTLQKLWIFVGDALEERALEARRRMRRELGESP